MKRLFILLSAILFAAGADGQLSQQHNSSEILQKILQLKSVGSVLYIAAHPDDENTRLLAYLAREKNVRTGYLSLTRGDGGQNLIGKEQGELLGVIRTQELLAARRTDGAEQFFTRAIDFGYSKTPEETFSIWNKDSVLHDVVLAIRKFKPDVIVCRFPTTGEGGHGHHTASAILALEAYEASADPRRFVSQLKHYKVWKSRRIFWNTFNFGGNNTTSPDQIQTDVGVFNPLLGKSYGEIASESRSMHKSQGFGTARQRGKNTEYFKLLKGDSVKEDIFQNINTSWSRFTETRELEGLIDKLIASYDASAPSRSLPQLIELHKRMSVIHPANELAAHYLNIKLRELADIIASCCGLWMEVATTEKYAVPNGTVSYSIQALKRTSVKAKLLAVRLQSGKDSIYNTELERNLVLNVPQRLICPENSFTSPFWLSKEPLNGRYDISEMAKINLPEVPPPFKFEFDLEIENYKLTFERYLLHKASDPVKGEVYQPFQVIPALTFSLSQKILLVDDRRSSTFTITIKAHRPTKGQLEATLPAGYSIRFSDPHFDLKTVGMQAQVQATVTAGEMARDGKLELRAIAEKNLYDQVLEMIQHEHIPHMTVLRNCTLKLIKIDLKKTESTVAYIPGAGDDVASCLEKIGYDVKIISAEEVASHDLSSFSSVITGVRAFNVHEELYSAMDQLNAYVEKGGNLIIQYNTNSRVGPLQSKIGPYSFTITRERVTDENSPVNFLDRNHAVFKYPNLISEKDFEGWVQERGIYFAADTDKHFEKLLEMNDPGQKSHQGSLIIARHGNGNIVYTGLSFFRQLPAGVPGAYRILVNLISLPKNQK